MSGGLLQTSEFTDSSSGLTIVKAFTSNLAGTNPIVVLAHQGSTPGVTFTIADTGLNTYASQQFLDDTTDSGTYQLWVCHAPAAGANTVTVTLSSAQAFRGAVLIEVSGCQQVASDQSAQANQVSPGTGTDVITTGNVTTSATDLCIGFTREAGGAGGMSLGTGFTQDPNALAWTGFGFGNKLMVEYRAGVSAGSTNKATFSSSSGTANFKTLAVWLKETAAAASARNLMLMGCGS